MLIQNKRSRSQSRSHSKESTNFKKQRLDDNNTLFQKTTAVEMTHKSICAFCGRDISRTIRIICDKCIDTEYCIDCLVICKGKDNTKDGHKHDYHIVDKLSHNVFTQEWTAAEEIMLLSSKI